MQLEGHEDLVSEADVDTVLPWMLVDCVLDDDPLRASSNGVMIEDEKDPFSECVPEDSEAEVLYRSILISSIDEDLRNLYGTTGVIECYKGCILVKPFACKVCIKAYTSRKNLRRHERSHLSGAFPCRKCVRIFDSEESLLKHKEVHVGSKYTCTICGRSFSSLTSLKHHVWNHSGSLPLWCSICGKGFAKPCKLKAHLLVHARKSHESTLPGQNFNEETVLQHHVAEKNSPDSIFPCPTCSKVFSTQERLKVHVVRHGNERPFQCSQCTSAFKESKGLARHLKRHQDDRPHKCPSCGKGFIERCKLARHLLTHPLDQVGLGGNANKDHSSTGGTKHVNGVVQENPYVADHSSKQRCFSVTCPLCSHPFDKRRSLAAHMKEHEADDRAFMTHAGRAVDKPYVCEVTSELLHNAR